MSDTGLSDKELRAVEELDQEKERRLHNIAIKGIAEDIGLIPKSHDAAEYNPNSESFNKKKRLKDAFMRATLQMVMEAQNRLMEQFDRELETLQHGLQVLQTKIDENRAQWQKNGQTLNDIDDLITDFEDGGKLDRLKAGTVLDDHAMLDDFTDAEIITLIEGLRTQTLENNEFLDTQFQDMERDQGLLKERKAQVLEAKTRLKDISNSDMSQDEKLSAINVLGDEIGTKTLHALSTQIHDTDVSQKADAVFLHSEASNANMSVKPAF